MMHTISHQPYNSGGLLTTGSSQAGPTTGGGGGHPHLSTPPQQHMMNQQQMTPPSPQQMHNGTSTPGSTGGAQVMGSSTPNGAGSQQGNMQSQAGPGTNTPLTSGGSSLGVTDNHQFEQDKKVIFNHPLFPLLQLLFEKCETATNSADCPSSASFDLDIENFIHLHERDRKPFYTDNADANDVMIRAIQVLRIHLLELEKVNELCKDFCQRYIACLKNKMQSDSLLGCGGGGGGQYPVSTSPNSQLQQQLAANCGAQSQVNHAALQQPPPSANQLLYPQLSMFPASMAAAAFNQSSPYQMGHMNGLGGHSPGGNGGMLSGSTPISQVGLQHQGGSPLHHHLLASHGQEMNPDGSYKKTKRGVLPKHATQIMRQWLFQHIVHPYPTEDEKRQIAVQTNLTLLQVNNWFINARRRILQPMLEASNPDSTPKSKKSKNSRPTAANRFWPDNLANGQIQGGSCKTECESPSPTDGGESTLNGHTPSNNNNMSLLSPSGLSENSEHDSSNGSGNETLSPSSQRTPGAGGGHGSPSNFLPNGGGGITPFSSSGGAAHITSSAQSSAGGGGALYMEQSS